jgi:hypothetical protein
MMDFSNFSNFYKVLAIAKPLQNTVQIYALGRMKTPLFCVTLDSRSATIHNYFCSHSHY